MNRADGRPEPWDPARHWFAFTAIRDGRASVVAVEAPDAATGRQRATAGIPEGTRLLEPLEIGERSAPYVDRWIPAG